MSPSVFRWAIVAPGRIAHKFADDLIKVPDACLQAVYARRLQQATDFAQLFEAQYATDDYQALLADPHINAVYIAAPHNAHFELALQALKAGKAVLCEKPLTVNHRQAATLVEAAQLYQTFLMEALWTRFLPGFAHVFDVINQGRLGAIDLVVADFGFHLPFDPQHRIYNPDLAGGALLDVGIYPAFLAYLFMGVPDTIVAQTRLAPTGVDQTTLIQFQYDDGRHASLMASTMHKTPTEAHIYGTHGRVHLAGRFHEPNAGATWHLHEQPPVFEPQTHTNRGYYFEIIAVQQAVRSGLIEHPWWSHRHSLDLMATLDRVRQAIGLVYPFEQ
jgi:predicted dehydrogenase